MLSAFFRLTFFQGRERMESTERKWALRPTISTPKITISHRDRKAFLFVKILVHPPGYFVKQKSASLEKKMSSFNAARQIFSIELAKQYGLTGSIIIDYVDRSIAYEQACFNQSLIPLSPQACHRLFPFFTEEKIIKAITHLCQQGVLLKQSNLYTFTPDFLQRFKFLLASAQKGGNPSYKAKKQGGCPKSDNGVNNTKKGGSL